MERDPARALLGGDGAWCGTARRPAADQRSGDGPRSTGQTLGEGWREALCTSFDWLVDCWEHGADFLCDLVEIINLRVIVTCYPPTVCRPRPRRATPTGAAPAANWTCNCRVGVRRPHAEHAAAMYAHSLARAGTPAEPRLLHEMDPTCRPRSPGWDGRGFR